MKLITTLTLFAVGFYGMLLSIFDSNIWLTYNFSEGDAKISSINKLAFGPDGILFVGDSETASIVALETEDLNISDGEEVDINSLDKSIAAVLGTTVDNVKISDMAVNPISKNIYLGVQTGNGNSVLLRLNKGKWEHLDLKNISHSTISLKDPIDTDAKDRRGRSQRMWAISDLKYHDGNIYVSGLSNKEFGSTFRKIAFPFNENQDHATLEIWHAAHGQFETQAPIKTFNFISINGNDHLLASYTCTPLTVFPLSELIDGNHVKGRTVAELGSGNSPLDMVQISKEGKNYFLLANTNRPLMRISKDDIAKFEKSLTDPVEEFAQTAGVDYISLPMVNVLQLDDYNDQNVIYIQRTAEGDLILKTRTKQWI